MGVAEHEGFGFYALRRGVEDGGLVGRDAGGADGVGGVEGDGDHVNVWADRYVSNEGAVVWLAEEDAFPWVAEGPAAVLD